jgi:hypothetical protein
LVGAGLPPAPTRQIVAPQERLAQLCVGARMATVGDANDFEPLVFRT